MGRRLMSDVDPIGRLIHFPFDITGIDAFGDYLATLRTGSPTRSVIGRSARPPACPDASPSWEAAVGGASASRPVARRVDRAVGAGSAGEVVVSVGGTMEV